MGAMLHAQAIRQYQRSSVDSITSSASPHQLVAMLLEGALDRIARAAGAARNGDRAAKLANVTAAISIIEYLRLCLDRNAGSISDRLGALYDFCLRHLAQANAANDARMLDEVADVLRPIKSGWDELQKRPAER
ncbi:MAG: flagellar export chaperone FliS [Panacagrimonas sp.]